MHTKKLKHLSISRVVKFFVCIFYLKAALSAAILLDIPQKNADAQGIDILSNESLKQQINETAKTGEDFYKLGRAYATAQVWDKAIEAYKKALELMPEDPDTEVSLAYALLFQSNTQENLNQSKQLFQNVLKKPAGLC